MTTYYFAYGKKSRNQLTQATPYRRVAVRARNRLGAAVQYGVGWLRVCPDRGIYKIGPGHINLTMPRLPKARDILWIDYDPGAPDGERNDIFAK